MTSPVVHADVLAAAKRLGTWPVRTPLLNNPTLDALCGGRIWFKPENLQHTGSFKFRGAMNRLLAIPPEGRRGGVVAYSSGNHAQGVARAAKLLGMPAVIVMPADAPKLRWSAPVPTAPRWCSMTGSPKAARRLRQSWPKRAGPSLCRPLPIR
jgi:threonine dehydratase